MLFADEINSVRSTQCPSCGLCMYVGRVAELGEGGVLVESYINDIFPVADQQRTFTDGCRKEKCFFLS